MTRTARAFVADLLGAGLALVALATPVGAEEVWLNEANDCGIFRLLGEMVPLGCAARGDTLVEAGPVIQTRGLKLGGRRRDDASGFAASSIAQEAVLVQQACAPHPGFAYCALVSTERN
jgi:hypothetical protein